MERMMISRVGMLLLALSLMSVAAAGSAAESATTSTQATTKAAPPPRPPMSRALAQSIAIGQQAPDFKVLTLDGNEVALKDTRGKVVLVSFYAGWCGFCVRDLPALKALYEEFGKNKKFAMLGLSLDDTMDRAEGYTEKHKIPWPQGFLGDWTRDRISREYKVKEIPAMFLIDPAGKIIDKEDHAKWLRESIARALKQK